MKLPEFASASTQTYHTGEWISRLVTNKRHFHLFYRLYRQNNTCEVAVNTEISEIFMIEDGLMRPEYRDDDGDLFFHRLPFHIISAMQ